MKNIHVLPTDNPSRIVKSQDNDFILLNTDVPNWFEINLNTTKQNIYITSDEEIKEGDWTIYLENLIKVTSMEGKTFAKEYSKKIILTTGQDLIKEGVQAIDDEFLEWFVKNPSCEEVEVRHKEIIQYGNMSMYDHNGDGSHYFCKDCEVETSRSKEELLKFGVEYYKIIIPKEESELKCDFCKRYPRLEGTNKCESCYSVVRHFLEQDQRFKDKLLPDLRKEQELPGVGRQIFKIVLDERMYSEEEVLELLQEYKNSIEKLNINNSIFTLKVKHWFEQFKKK